MERNNIIEKKAVRRPRRVLEYWRGLILNLKTNMNFGTARNYRNSLYRFSEFLDRHDIAFSKIDADLVSDYELWLRKRGLKMNSVSFYLRCLRSVCNQAVSEGIARRIVPFQKVFTGVCTTRKLAVPEAVFSKLLHWQLPPEQESLALSRDIFLFSYCARGMAFVDIAFLRRLVQLRAPQDGATAHRAHRAADGCHNQPLQKRSRRVCVPDNQCRRTGCLSAIPDGVGLSQP